MQTSVAGAEPPSLLDAADRVLAMAHTRTAPHVAVIGHHALPFMLALLERGCACVRTQRPDAVAPDCEPADLAWIVNIESEHELDDALRVAHRRSHVVVLEGSACRRPDLCQHARQAGLDIVSVDSTTARMMLADHTSR